MHAGADPRRPRKDLQQTRERDPGTRDLELIWYAWNIRLQRHERGLDCSLLDDRSDGRTINQREIVLVLCIRRMNDAPEFDLRIPQDFTA